MTTMTNNITVTKTMDTDVLAATPRTKLMEAVELLRQEGIPIPDLEKTLAKKAIAPEIKLTRKDLKKIVQYLGYCYLKGTRLVLSFSTTADNKLTFHTLEGYLNRRENINKIRARKLKALRELKKGAV